jgi:chromate transport protein ChrA
LPVLPRTLRTVKIVYRIVAVLLTVVSAVITALLITVATDEDKTIKVLNFTLFAVGAAIALILALLLWQRASNITSPKPKEQVPPE